MSGTEKDFEETVKRLLKMPAKTRGKDNSDKDSEGEAEAPPSKSDKKRD